MTRSLLLAQPSMTRSLLLAQPPMTRSLLLADPPTHPLPQMPTHPHTYAITPDFSLGNTVAVNARSSSVDSCCATCCSNRRFISTHDRTARL